MAGFVILHVGADSGGGGRVAEIATLDVHPDHRRRGLGTSLMSQVEALAVAESVRILSLHVATTNSGAISLYRRLGFNPVARARAYYPGGRDAWVMLKPALG